MNGLKDPEINVFDTVVDLRFDRPGMVQTSVIASFPPSPFFATQNRSFQKIGTIYFLLFGHFGRAEELEEQGDG